MRFSCRPAAVTAAASALLLASLWQCHVGVQGFSTATTTSHSHAPAFVRTTTITSPRPTHPKPHFPDLANSRIQASRPTSSTRLYHGHSAAPEPTLDLSQLGLLGSVLESPIFWSTTIMLTIVFLLFSWEKAIQSARERLPTTIQPVVDSMLVEMGGLGFIGLFLSVVVVGGPMGGLVGAFSQEFLGDSDILMESFEFLHSAFFEVAVSFFLVTAVTVVGVVKQIESLESVSRAVFDLDGDGQVTLSEIAEVLNVDSVVVDLDGDGILSDEEIAMAQQIAPRSTIFTEVFKSIESERGEALVVRERLLQEYDMDESKFQLENYFTKIFGKNLEEMVELSPLTWLPLIPVIALGTSIDLSRDIVSASSANAFESCGEFISNLGFLTVQAGTVAVAVIWGVWNFWKMVEIKNMLIPTLVRDAGGAPGEDTAVLLPPRYEDEQQMAQFNSSPFPVNLIESIWGKPARNIQEQLFGAAGRKGKEIYSNSIKCNVWLVVAQLVFITTQIVARDLSALSQGLPASVREPEMVPLELAVYGFFAALLVGQLWLVPKTFLDFSKVTSIEKFIEADVLTEACLIDGQCEIDLDEDEGEEDFTPNGEGQEVSKRSGEWSGRELMG